MRHGQAAVVYVRGGGHDGGGAVGVFTDDHPPVVRERSHGGRAYGLTAVTTALLFTLSMLLLPLLASLPAVATIPCMLFIGANMMQQVVDGERMVLQKMSKSFWIYLKTSPVFFHFPQL